MRRKWLILTVLVSIGAFQVGTCLSTFWTGMSRGVSNNRWLDLTFDVVNELVLG